MDYAEIKNEVQEYVESLAIVVKSKEDYLSAGDVLKEIKRRIKMIDDRLEPEKAKAYRAYQAWINLIKELKAPYAVKEQEIKEAMLAWDREQRRIQQAEEERLRELARKQAERDREKLAKKLEKQGDTENAELVRQEEIIAPTITTVTQVPRVDGISTRGDWKYKIVDESLIPREFLKVDEVKLGKYARAMRSAAKVAGVEFYEESVISVKAG